MTTASEDRHLELTVRRYIKSVRHLISELLATGGTAVTRQMTYNKLNGKGIFARQVRAGVSLSSQRKRNRINWWKEHQN